MQEQLSEGAGSEWNYLSRMTNTVAMYCICLEQWRLSDAADTEQERQMVARCWNSASSMSTLRRRLDCLIDHQLYTSVILVGPSHVTCGVIPGSCNKEICNNLVYLAPSLTSCFPLCKVRSVTFSNCSIVLATSLMKIPVIILTLGRCTPSSY